MPVVVLADLSNPMIAMNEVVLRAGSGFWILDITMTASLTKVGFEKRFGMMKLLPDMMGMGRGLGTDAPVDVVMPNDWRPA